MEIEEINVRTREIISAAMKVHSILGPGLLEAVYEACLAYELRKRGFHVATQVMQPVVYEGVTMDLAYRIDLIVDGAVVVELKAINKLQPIHEAQLLSHLRLGKFRVGLLINFHTTRLKDGIRRLIN